MPRELTAAELRRVCDARMFDFDSTAQVEPLEGTIGQRRAVDALIFGLEMRGMGYNIYVSGVPGTGRNFAVHTYVSEHAEAESVPADWIYVHNFDDPSQPRAVSLPAGEGRALARDLEDLVEACRREIPRAFDSENYRRRRGEALEDVEARRKKMLSDLEQEAQRRRLSVQVTPMGVAVAPTRDGEPMTRQEFAALPEAEQREIERVTADFRDRVNEAMNRLRDIEKEMRERIESLDREVALFAIGHLLDGLRHRWAEREALRGYLDDVQDDIIHHLDHFRGGAEHDPQQPPALAALQGQFEARLFDRYRVNVFVDNSATRGAPVVVEWNPTYYNLLGRLEYRSMFGGMVTDFNLVKAGALHRANGGYLVVQAWDLLRSPLAWDRLKTTLRAGEGRIENIGEQFSPLPAATLRPEAIPIDVKVIMVGPPALHFLLSYLDEDFRKLFKVKADFDIIMPREQEHIREYVGFIAARCREHGLRPLGRDAVCEVVEYGARATDHQNKLTTRFLDITELLREADHWAAKRGDPEITAQHVREAIEQHYYRSRLVEEHLLDQVAEGALLIDTAGAAVGQVNALSIVNLGNYVFGRPNRVTARTRMGKGELVDIEREAKLGGDLFHKAILITTGYLAGRYVPDRPLSLSASLAFEQSYAPVEGDSASIAEVCALLSSLAEAPIKQSLAVTGSMNQHGQAQAVGGVTRKIEGFFEVCKRKGRADDQGVVIPAANVQHLMLQPEVVDAVRDGRFHIYPVTSVDEAMEVLTGVPAGERGPEGEYPPGSINARVEERLRRFAERVAEFARPMQPPPTEDSA